MIIPSSAFLNGDLSLGFTNDFRHFINSILSQGSSGNNCRCWFSEFMHSNRKAPLYPLFPGRNCILHHSQHGTIFRHTFYRKQSGYFFISIFECGGAFSKMQYPSDVTPLSSKKFPETTCRKFMNLAFVMPPVMILKCSKP